MVFPELNTGQHKKAKKPPRAGERATLKDEKKQCPERTKGWKYYLSTEGAQMWGNVNNRRVWVKGIWITLLVFVFTTLILAIFSKSEIISK